MSEVRAAHDALQQEIMELTQEQRSVLTDRHVESQLGTRTDESEQQMNEMHTLQRQLDEQLAESLSRVSECRSCAAKESWSDEIIKVPNGDACLSADGEKYSPSQNRSFVLGR